MQEADGTTQSHNIEASYNLLKKENISNSKENYKTVVLHPFCLSSVLGSIYVFRNMIDACNSFIRERNTYKKVYYFNI